MDLSFEFVLTKEMQVIEHAPRALVYLTVEWSGPERKSREVVRAVLNSMPHRDFGFFAIEEDDAVVTAPWLDSRGWTNLPRGTGTLLWLEFGKLAHAELLPSTLGRDAILATTRSLWGQSMC